MDVENPEDANELAIYKRVIDIERRLDKLDEKHDKLRDDYTHGRKEGRRKTRKRTTSAGRKRRNKTKKKRHIITRKNKRKRRRRTKKRKRGGMPKGKPKRLAALKETSFRTLDARNKFKKTRKKKVRFRPLSRSNSVRSDLNTMSIRDTTAEKKFEPIPKETEGQSKMDTDDGNLDTELSNIFANMRTPSEAERRHNSDKTLASRITNQNK